MSQRNISIALWILLEVFLIVLLALTVVQQQMLSQESSEEVGEEEGVVEECGEKPELLDFWDIDPELAPLADPPSEVLDIYNAALEQWDNCKATLSWQTYRNEEFGFEVKYPEEWELARSFEKGFSEVELRNSTQSSSIYIEATINSDRIAYIQGGERSDVFYLAGNEWKGFLHLEDNPGEFADFRTTLAITALRNGKQYIIRLTPNEALIPSSSFDQILSTFKFIERSNADYSGELTTLTSFTDSKGIIKYILTEWKIEDEFLFHYLWLSTTGDKESPKTLITKIGLGISFPSLSNNPGVKFLVFELFSGDFQDFLIVNETGQAREIDSSNIGLGTKIPGQYGLHFGGWQETSTNFKINILSANGYKYEALFDATTGKQIGETKQIGTF